MSEKFGLDWQKYDSARMEALYLITQYRAEREAREHKKSAKMKSSK